MRRRTIVITVAAVAVLAAATIGTVVAVQQFGAESGPECQVPDRQGGPALELDAVQLQHASTINAVGVSRGLPERARVIALATAFQESSMRNLPDGDRDSLGLFQQRPSQGWGTVAQISDPVYSAGKFYDALVDVPDWQTGELTEVAQAVQYSGFPDAYAKWEHDAQTLATGLAGTTTPTLGCRAGATASTAPEPQRDPLPGTENASPRLRDLLAAAGTELGGITLVDQQGSGATIVGVALDGMTPEQAARVLSSWAVAHATGYGVTEVATTNEAYVDHAWATAASDLEPGQVRIVAG